MSVVGIDHARFGWPPHAAHLRYDCDMYRREQHVRASVPAVIRRTNVGAGVVCLFFILTLAFNIWVQPVLAPNIDSDVTLGIPLTAAVVAGLWLHWVRLRSLRRAQKYEFMVCPQCEYPLPDAAEIGLCSECGYNYRAERVRSVWRSQYDRYRRIWSPLRSLIAFARGRG